MKMKKISRFLMGAILILLVSSSYGQKRSDQNGKPNADKIIKYLDSNKDGKISKTEASKAKRGRLADNFEKIDANKDGYLSKEELENMSKKRKDKG